MDSSFPLLTPNPKKYCIMTQSELLLGSKYYFFSHNTNSQLSKYDASAGYRLPGPQPFSRYLKMAWATQSKRRIFDKLAVGVVRKRSHGVFFLSFHLRNLVHNIINFPFLLVFDVKTSESMC